MPSIRLAPSKRRINMLNFAVFLVKVCENSRKLIRFPRIFENQYLGNESIFKKIPSTPFAPFLRKISTPNFSRGNKHKNTAK